MERVNYKRRARMLGRSKEREKEIRVSRELRCNKKKGRARIEA